MALFSLNQDKSLTVFDENLGVQFEKNVTLVELVCPMTLDDHDMIEFNCSLVMDDLPLLNMSRLLGDTDIVFSVLLPEGYTDRYGVRAVQFMLYNEDMEVVIRTKIGNGFTNRSPSFGDAAEVYYPTILASIDSKLAGADSVIQQGEYFVTAATLQAGLANDHANRAYLYLSEFQDIYTAIEELGEDLEAVLGQIASIAEDVSGYVVDCSGYVEAALGHASDALDQAILASGYAQNALDYSLDAKDYRDQAAQIVGGPYFLQEEAQYYIDKLYKQDWTFLKTLNHNSWTGTGPYTYTLKDSKPDNTIMTYRLDVSNTPEQMTAAVQACISLSESNGLVTITANGIKPTVHIILHVTVDHLVTFNPDAGQAS